MNLREIFIEPFEDRDYFSGILIWVISLLSLILVSSILLYFIDSSFMHDYKKRGIITKEYIVKSHYTTTYSKVGTVSVPITTFHPTKFYLRISIDNLNDDVSVTHLYFNSVDTGDKVYCRYNKGRIFNTIYINEIYY